MFFKTALITSFLIGVIGSLVGAWLTIIHAEPTDALFIAAIGGSVVFILLALYEVLSSNRIERMEKILWAVGLLFVSGVAGFIYLIMGRKRVANNP